MVAMVATADQSATVAMVVTAETAQTAHRALTAVHPAETGVMEVPLVVVETAGPAETVGRFQEMAATAATLAWAETVAMVATAPTVLMR
jgi:hypothetical protein